VEGQSLLPNPYPKGKRKAPSPSLASETNKKKSDAAELDQEEQIKDSDVEEEIMGIQKQKISMK
jgi:hypothetical protein